MGTPDRLDRTLATEQGSRFLTPASGYLSPVQSSPPSRWPISAIAVSVVLALLVVASGVGIAFTTVRVAELRADLTGLRSALAASEARIADLERELASDPDQPLGGLGEFFGGSGEGFGLGDLLGCLLGAEENAGDLAELLRRLLGDEGADRGGLLGGLLGGLESCLLNPPA